jgi:6-phosphofructokinase 1
MSAIAGGAEAVLVPEFEPDSEALLGFLKLAYDQGKSHFIVVAAEGARPSADEFNEYVNNTGGVYESRFTSIGHIQRGGNPSAFDRILATRLGVAAVGALADGETGTMVAYIGEQVKRIPLEEVVGKTRPLDPEVYKMAGVLAELPT